MTNVIEDYIKLAERARADYSEVRCEETALQWFEKYSNRNEHIVPVVLTLFPALAKALLEAEHTLVCSRVAINAMSEIMDIEKMFCPEKECLKDIDKALATIARLKEGK